MASIEILDPVTGNPLNCQASLTGAYMLIGRQIFTFDFTSARSQHTPLLDKPFLLNVQSYAIGLSLLTKATKGQIKKIDVAGTPRQGRVLTTK